MTFVKSAVGLPLRMVAHALALIGIVLASPGSAFAQQSAGGPYHIGVFYFPGWMDNDLGAPSPKPWESIKPFPERKPLIGYYKEGDPAILKRQLGEMAQNGISFMVMDLLFQRDGSPSLTHVIDQYLKLKDADRHGIGFVILWANHSRTPENAEQFYALVRYATRHYMHDRDYMKVNGRPQFFVNFQWALAQKAAVFHIPVKVLFDQAQAIARQEGFPGIDFLAGDPHTIADVRGAGDEGYAGFQAYGYSNAPASSTPAGRTTHNYAEMDMAYRQAWDLVAANAGPGMRYFVPITAGWDHRPWGPSKDPLHDDSRSTPAEFGTHLKAARSFIDSHSQLTGGYGVVCCWNEFGEGSFIEPTEGDGGAHLREIGAVFGHN